MFASIGSVIVSILILSVLVMVHEFGHYIAGKKLGFAVPEFSIGFGPKIFGWRRGDTDFSIRCLLLGGYCRFLGEDEEGGDDPSAMNNRPVWARMIVTAAGSLMNILLGIILAIVTVGIFGTTVLNDKAYVYQVDDNSPAYEAGLLSGDEIIEYDGTVIESVDGAVGAIGSSKGGETLMTVLRNGEEVTLTVVPKYVEDAGVYRIGISIAQGTETVRYGFFGCVKEGARQVWTMVESVFQFLGQLFGSLYQKLFVDNSVKVEGTDDVMSVIGVVGLMSTAVQTNFELFMWIAVLLCANLGVMNLLPIPALDGSRLLFQLFELVTGKRIKPEHEGIVHIVGFVLLMALFVVLGWRDVANLIAK